MNDPETITHNGKIAAIVIRESVSPKGTTFYSDPHQSFQLGLQIKAAGEAVRPHEHILQKDLVIAEYEEFFVVHRGKIRVTLYDEASISFSTTVLNAGDAMLLIDIAHGVEYLEDSRVIEIKQGPFQESVIRKQFIQPET